MDQFDRMMNASGDILEYPAGSGDTYGRRPKAAITVKQAAIPCRVYIRTTQGRQKNNEAGVTNVTRKAMMRPQTFKVTNAMFLRVNNYVYRITQVDDPSLLGHHLELWLEETEL